MKRTHAQKRMVFESCSDSLSLADSSFSIQEEASKRLPGRKPRTLKKQKKEAQAGVKLRPAGQEAVRIRPGKNEDEKVEYSFSPVL